MIALICALLAALVLLNLRRRSIRRRLRRRYIPAAIRRAVLLRDRGRCQVCGSADRPELDHIWPVCLGGRSTTDNLRILCRYHNRQKGGRVPRKW